MPTQRLVIDGDDKERFCLVVHDGTLTVGADPMDEGITLGPLRVVRIHCEVEVEEGPVAVGTDPSEAGEPGGQKLQLGQELHVGPAHVRLVAGSGAAAPARPVAAEPAPRAAEAAARPEPPPSPVEEGLVRRLVVIDGADAGQVHLLPEMGRTSIGNSRKHADIVLHDLYVSRVQCELEVEGDRVHVKHLEGRSPTRINGKEITAQDLQVGDVLRVGNSHLRFEIGVAEDRPAAPDDDSEAVGLAPEETDAAADEPDPDAALEPLAELEGHVLGNYHFGPVLGRGISSLVFQGRHRQTNQTAVVKVLSRDFPQNDAELQTFVKALKVVAPLRHPNLVTLIAAGKAGPHCWIAREYVAGENLASLIGRLQEEGKLGWKRACRVAIHLGRVLELLQRNKVVPGPLTPANVLIEEESRATKLADVMLDQALRGSRLEEITREKRQAAELPYCAPEQTEPGATVDQTAALYGLGALLYTLLTGQPPFTGKNQTQLIARIQNANVVKPSKTLRDIPPPFEAAVLQLLAKRPEDRIQSAAELLAVVEPLAGAHEIKV